MSRARFETFIVYLFGIGGPIAMMLLFLWGVAVLSQYDTTSPSIDTFADGYEACRTDSTCH